MAKQTLKEKINQPKSPELVERVAAINKRLPVDRSSAAKVYFNYYSEEGFTNSVKNISRVRNVLYYRVTDEKITTNLEGLLKILLNEK